MSKGHTFRSLMNARLTAAAEEIYALFERTIAEYEEELCRFKKENERRQQLLDSRAPLHTEDVQIQTELPPQEKVEDDLCQDVTRVVVKSEYEDISDNEENSEPPCSSSAQQMDTDTDQSQKDQSANDDLCGRAAVDKTNECPICQKKMTRRHMLVHTGEKPYSCSEKRFRQKRNLKAHVEPHTDATETIENEEETGAEELHDADARVSSPEIEIEIEDDNQVCQKDSDKATDAAQNSSNCSKPKRKCVEKRSLQVVVKSHALTARKNMTRAKVRFTCPECERTFKLLHHLQRHILTHTGERSFSCSVCQKSFKLKQHLTSHMAVHTGEKLYVCSICNKTFNRKDNLSTHLRNHSGAQPFKCPQCDVRFSLKKNLTRHMTVHSRDTTYSCSVCKLTFSSPFYFQKHKKSHKKKKANR